MSVVTSSTNGSPTIYASASNQNKDFSSQEKLSWKFAEQMANYKSAFLPALLSFLLIASVVHCRQFDTAFGGESAPAALTCAAVYGAEQDDTCISVGLKFKLDETAFLRINPNINCNTIFVGQWLCVNGNA